jgi:hypothetical protein
MIKDILNKIKNIFKTKKEILESDDSYCYSKVIWNSPDNLIILLSFTKDYFEQIIEIQDAINYAYRNLCSKIVYSSYDEEITREENGKTINDIIAHKKYYMLIGGDSIEWYNLYCNIHDLGNEALSIITDEIVNNRSSEGFEELIKDGVLFGFVEDINYDKNIIVDDYNYNDPKVILERLPSGFTGRDVIKFIKINTDDDYCVLNIENEDNEDEDALSYILRLTYLINRDNNEFKSYPLYPLYSALFKDPTVKKLYSLFDPLYKQPDDDAIPGDVSDETLDAIFKENYERFSAVADESMYYEDIDEILEDDEESDNMREGDKIE